MAKIYLLQIFTIESFSGEETYRVAKILRKYDGLRLNELIDLN